MSGRALADREQALLVAYVDGTATGRGRRRAEELLAGLPGGAELVERQRRVADALAGGPVPAARASSRPARAGSRLPRLAAAVALAAAAAALALVAVRSPAGEPSVAAAAELTALPAAGSAPEPRPAATELLRVDLDGVAFPNWGDEHGWHATGVRSDRLGDRGTTTVFYEHEGHRIGYTIVSGPALDPPAGAERLRRNGVELALYRDGQRDVAVFVRDGRTCVLAGHVLERSTLVRLASWKGDGAIPF